MKQLVTIAVTIGQMQTSYQHLETDDIGAFTKETFENARKGFVCTTSHGGAVGRMMLVGPAMEVSVWPQEKYDGWMAENNRARARDAGGLAGGLLVPDLIARGRRQ